jgi:hypothetical protein
MRLALIALIAALQLLAVSAPVFACPDGYAACGTRYCCPR